MGTPYIKVYSAEREYVASCRYFEDAACLVSALYHLGTVRIGHGLKDTVWTEGREEFSAGESYDGAARIMIERARAIRAAKAEKSAEKQKRLWESIQEMQRGVSIETNIGYTNA